jgi:hypothetical protein
MSDFDASEFVRERCGGNDVPDNAEYCQEEIETVAKDAYLAGLRRGAEIARATEGPAIWSHYYGYQAARDDIAAAIDAEASKT